MLTVLFNQGFAPVFVPPSIVSAGGGGTFGVDNHVRHDKIERNEEDELTLIVGMLWRAVNGMP